MRLYFWAAFVTWMIAGYFVVHDIAFVAALFAFASGAYLVSGINEGLKRLK